MADYDLEERTFQFAKDVRGFVKKLPRTVSNIEDVRQLIRASASIGANYIEANENLGDKDKKMKLKISRKESKESRFFLRLLSTDEKQSLEKEREKLVQESFEFV